MVSCSSSRLRIFDVRRAAAGAAELPHVGTLSPAPPHRLPPHACLDVSDGVLVVGGGAKSSAAFRFSVTGLTNGAGVSGATDDPDEEVEQHRGQTSRTKSKPARWTKKQWSHESSGRGAGRRKA
eukprot:5474968-Prymnesium_polylepis.1